MNRFIDDCNISKVRTLYIHDPWNIPKEKYFQTIEEFKILKQKKMINEIGLSIYWDKQDYDLTGIDRVQVPFSVMHGKAIKFLHNFKKKGTKITVRNVFLQGRLLSKIGYEHFAGSNDLKIIPQKKLVLNDAWRLNSALSVLNISELDNVVVGIDSSSQLREILNQVTTNRPELMQVNLGLLDPRNWSET